MSPLAASFLSDSFYLWGDARFLWLLPLALLPLLRRRSIEQTVSSTSPWIGLRGTGRARRAWIRSLLVTFLILGAAEPLRVKDAPATDAKVAVRVIEGRACLDRIPTPEQSNHPELTWRAVSKDGTVWIEEQPLRLGSVPLPFSAHGQKGWAIDSDGTRTAIHVPATPPLPQVRDNSGSPAVARAITALRIAGRIAPEDDGAAVTLEFTTVSGGTTHGERLRRVVFPTVDAQETRVLPAIDSEPLSSLVRGLAPERFTIYSATDLPRDGEAILADREGNPLIARSRDGFRFAFRPEQSDLPDRPEWPVLIGRLIEGLATSPIPTSPASSVPTLLAFLCALGCVPWAMGSARGRMGAAFAIVVVLFTPEFSGPPGPDDDADCAPNALRPSRARP